MRYSRLLYVLLLAMLTSGRAVGDDIHLGSQGQAPERPHLKAHLQSGYGTVDFPISCELPATQAFFNQAVAMLHGFDAWGADRSFRQAASLEPECAMAYWGMALANVETVDRMRGLIGLALERQEKASPRERRWIAALAQCVPTTDDSGVDLVRVAEAFKKLALDIPSDMEAKALYVTQVCESRRADVPMNDVDTMERWIDEVLVEERRHPLHGRGALLWEEADLPRALASAERASEAAPENPYLCSLAGRLSARQGRYGKAVEHLERAVSLFAAQRHRDRRMPDDIEGYAEAKDMLVENLARIGRVREAIAIARDMTRMPVSLPSTVDSHLAPDPGSHRSLGVRRLASLLADFEMWDELEAWAPKEFFLGPELEASLRYAMGRAAFARRRVEFGNQQLTRLRYLYADAIDQAYAGGGHKHGHIRDEERAAVVLPQRVDRIQGFIQNLLLCRALAKGDLVTLRERLRRRPSPDSFFTPPFYWALGEHDKAIRGAEQAWRRDPRNVSTLARSFEFFREIGRQDQATDLEEEWKQVASNFIGSAPAASWNLGTWKPSLAPNLSLLDRDRKLHRLDDYRGRPLLLVFYLGAGCPHCIEQLQILAPQVARFSGAGIRILAISTDSVEGLGLTYEAMGAKELLPFPIVSDRSLDTFCRYGVMDEFLSEPLHGTFLVDCHGRLRWKNVSVEPFFDFRFLLEECQPLLASAPQAKSARTSHTPK